MRSFTTRAVGFFAHHEKNPSVKKLRLLHPIVVLCHLAFIVILVNWWWYRSDNSFGVTVAFMVTLNLYCSSTTYHATHPSPLVRWWDQVSIAAFILMPPVVFLYHEPLTLPLYGATVAIVAIVKWYRLEQNHTVEAAVFFLLGASSFIQITLWGMAAIGQPLTSLAYLRICVATFFFIAKLYVYQLRKLRLVPGWWESPESGHFFCANGVYQLLSVVVENPV